MKEIEALKVLFDKKACAIHECSGKWIVSESASNATFTCLEVICKNVNFCEIKNEFYSGIKNITENRSSHLCDLDCDGVSIAEIDGVKHFIFVDLKSNFDLDKIKSAYRQDLHTLLKLHTMLSLCEGYDLQDCIVDLMVACKTFKDKDQEDRVMDLLLQKKTLEEKSFENNILNDLLYGNHPKICKMGDFKFIKDLPFHSKIKQVKVRIHLVLSKKYEDASSIYMLT